VFVFDFFFWLQALGSAYPSSLEDDEKMLETGEGLSMGQRACLAHLISQKRIVRSNLALLEERETSSLRPHTLVA
jgi:hypothetical protein